jgi:hypothetical protein
MKGVILGILGGAGVGKDTAADYLVSHHGFAKMSLADDLKRFAKKVFSFSDAQLWGPSELRNTPLGRFKFEEVWVDALWKLTLHSPEWCRQHFDDPPRASLELFSWFCALRNEYGPVGKLPSGGLGLSPRVALQTLGTDFGRKVDGQVWVRATVNIAKAILQGGRYTRELGLLPGHEVCPPAGVIFADVRFVNEVVGVQENGGLVLRLYRTSKVDPLTIGVKGHASETELLTISDEAVDYVLHAADGLPALYAQLDALMESIRKDHLS